MGIYMLSRDVLPFITEGIPYGFDSLMRDLLKIKRSVNVSDYGGYWLDIGRPDDYMQAIEQFESMKHIFLSNEI